MLLDERMLLTQAQNDWDILLRALLLVSVKHKDEEEGKPGGASQKIHLRCFFSGGD